VASFGKTDSCATSPRPSFQAAVITIKATDFLFAPSRLSSTKLRDLLCVSGPSAD